MDIEYIKENYRFETLTKDHDLSNFECDSEDLTNFLKDDAFTQQKRKLNLTKLIICDDELIGYVSLLTDTIPLKDIRDEETRKDIKNQLNITSKKRKLPAIKIGRLAIDKKYSKQGLGSEILMSILFNIKNLAESSVGLRFVTVEGYAKAYNFYVEHNNFINLKKDDMKIKEELDIIIERNPEQTFYLYLDLKVLE
ncbi:MAG: N-acetyltransferase [Methanobrevibacter sp.]|nr:N-acetyltransferase [Methanobrevibacter sp.]